MTPSEPWSDINPPVQAARADRAARARARRTAQFAAQLIDEGQLPRARRYLQQALDQIEDME